MAHTKGQKLTAQQGSNLKGRRLGVKKFGGESVRNGDIIVRQIGNKYHPGKNVGQGKDFTLFSKIEGIVNFRKMTGYKRGKKIVDVLGK